MSALANLTSGFFKDTIAQCAIQRHSSTNQLQRAPILTGRGMKRPMNAVEQPGGSAFKAQDHTVIHPQHNHSNNDVNGTILDQCTLGLSAICQTIAGIVEDCAHRPFHLVKRPSLLSFEVHRYWPCSSHPLHAPQTKRQRVVEQRPTFNFIFTRDGFGTPTNRYSSIIEQCPILTDSAICINDYMTNILMMPQPYLNR